MSDTKKFHSKSIIDKLIGCDIIDVIDRWSFLS
jgi:hypothetical protein